MKNENSRWQCGYKNRNDCNKRRIAWPTHIRRPVRMLVKTLGNCCWTMFRRYKLDNFFANERKITYSNISFFRVNFRDIKVTTCGTATRELPFLPKSYRVSCENDIRIRRGVWIEPERKVPFCNCEANLNSFWMECWFEYCYEWIISQ